MYDPSDSVFACPYCKAEYTISSDGELRSSSDSASVSGREAIPVSVQPASPSGRNAAVATARASSPAMPSFNPTESAFSASSGYDEEASAIPVTDDPDLAFDDDADEGVPVPVDADEDGGGDSSATQVDADTPDPRMESDDDWGDEFKAAEGEETSLTESGITRRFTLQDAHGNAPGQVTAPEAAAPETTASEEPAETVQASANGHTQSNSDAAAGSDGTPETVAMTAWTADDDESSLDADDTSAAARFDLDLGSDLPNEPPPIYEAQTVQLTRAELEERQSASGGGDDDASDDLGGLSDELPSFDSEIDLNEEPDLPSDLDSPAQSDEDIPTLDEDLPSLDDELAGLPEPPDIEGENAAPVAAPAEDAGDGAEDDGPSEAERELLAMLPSLPETDDEDEEDGSAAGPRFDVGIRVPDSADEVAAITAKLPSSADALGKAANAKRPTAVIAQDVSEEEAKSTASKIRAAGATPVVRKRSSD